MRRYVFSLTILATVMLGPSLAMAGDHEIAQVIVERLQAQKKAGMLKGFSLDLQVEEGTVWLTGRVSSAEQQTLALEIARRVPGVKQVVNDISVDQVAQAKKPAANRNLFASLAGKVKQAVGQEEQPVQVEPAPVGTGIEGGNDYFAGTPDTPAPIPAPAVASPLPQQFAGSVPQQFAGPMPQQFAGPLPQQFAGPVPQQFAGPMPQQYYRPNLPMAYAPARTIAYQGGAAPAEASGQPVPLHIPGAAIGMAPARYDHPYMPGYAWPSYASYPNYGAVTYPRQYSPTAWPYIGPFYPYPQVPLGWRKVTLEWDDGWWMLDFNDCRHWKH